MGEQLVPTGQVAKVAAADVVDVGRVAERVCREEPWQDVIDSCLAAASFHRPVSFHSIPVHLPLHFTSVLCHLDVH